MKNRVLRSALAVILVIAMVLTMAACNNTDPVETTAPVVSSAPATTVAPTDAPEVTVTPTETPSVDVVDTVEAQLNEYGITFPEFELSYLDDGDDDYGKGTMAFGLNVDQDNDYQEAYTFEISAKITAVALDGSSLSASKYSPTKLGLTNVTKVSDGYYDSSEISTWVSGSSTATDKYYFQVGAAGIYTVTYTIAVEHDKNAEYGYYTPGEVDEKYTITKTYTVEKGELNLKTSNDAFKVETSMFFVDATYANSGIFADVASDYSVSIDVTSCTGTEVGEYTLAITIKDKDDNVVDPSDIELANYYVTVTEGTRYILSAEDVAKANAVRKMYSADQSVKVTTEYSQETITYYNTLTAGQKVLASVKNTADNWAKYYESYLVSSAAVSSSAITEAEYNMNRDYIITEVETAIETYMTASTSAKKDAAKTALAELLLSIDNDAHKYGSDLSYVLGNLVTGVYVDTAEYDNGEEETEDKVLYAYYGVTESEGAYTWTLLEDGTYYAFDGEQGAIYFVVQSEVNAMTALSGDPTKVNEDATYDSVTLISGYDYEDTTNVYSVYTDEYTNDESIVAYTNVEDDETYYVSFGYEMGIVSATDYPVVNDKYDGYLQDWIEDYEKAYAAYDTVVKSQEIEQSDIDDLTKHITNMKGEYADLITAYQLSYKVTAEDNYSSSYADENAIFDGSEKVSALHADLVALADQIVTRWDAYIALIEAYGFESSYIDNANQSELQATFAAMEALLGYDLSNNTLSSIVYKLNAAYGYASLSDQAILTLPEDVKISSDVKIAAGEHDANKVSSVTVAEFSGNILVAATGDGDAATEYDKELHSAYDYYITVGDENYAFISGVTYTAELPYAKTLSNALFASNGTFATPNLFVEGVLGQAEAMMQIAIAVQAEVDAVGQDLVNYLVSTGKYSDLAEGNSGYKYEGYSSYTSTGYLSDINAWMDTYVSTELMTENSDFYKNLEKKGLSTAMTELFSDIIEDAEKQIDTLAKNLKAGITTTSANGTASASDETIVASISNAVISYSAEAIEEIEISTTGDVAEVVNGTTATVTNGVVTIAGTALTAGDYTFTVDVTVTFTGAYSALGSTTVPMTVTYTA